MNRLYPRTDWTGLAAITVAAAAIVSLAALGVTHPDPQPQPRPAMVKLCDRPTEDSSTNGCLTNAHADYHDGAWWVTVK